MIRRGLCRELGCGLAGDAGRGEEPDQRAHDEFDEGDAEGLDGPAPRPVGIECGVRVRCGLRAGGNARGWLWVVRLAVGIGRVRVAGAVTERGRAGRRGCGTAGDGVVVEFEAEALLERDCSCTRPRLSRCRSSERRRWSGSRGGGDAARR